MVCRYKQAHKLCKPKKGWAYGLAVKVSIMQKQQVTHISLGYVQSYNLRTYNGFATNCNNFAPYKKVGLAVRLQAYKVKGAK